MVNFEMEEKKKRSKAIVQQIKRDPQIEMSISKSIFSVLEENKIAVAENEILVLVPVVVERPSIIWEEHPCYMGICPPDWLKVKESISSLFSIEKLDAFKRFLG